MSPDEVAAIRAAFSESLEPVVQELKAIHVTLDEHSKLLQTHGELLRNIDQRLTNVEGNLDGVEILVRRRAG